MIRPALHPIAPPDTLALLPTLRADGTWTARTLFVVEFRDTPGEWRPCCGDSYLDAEEAERVSRQSGLDTRVTVYQPVSE